MSKKIELTKGRVAIVDDDIFDFVSPLKWSAHPDGRTCYAERNITTFDGKRKRITLHHVIAGFPLNKLEIDHIDGNGLNNQRSNLQIVTHRQNCMNNFLRRTKRTKSLYVGVHQSTTKGKWVSHVRVKKIIYYLGTFTSQIKAFNAYKEAIAQAALRSEEKV